MIVPMKKLSVVFLAKEEASVLAELARLGCVHIQPGLSPNPDKDAAAAALERWQGALNALGSLKASGPAPLNAAAAADRLAALAERQTEIHTRRAELFKRLDALAPWGDFDPATLKALAGAGYEARLYALNPEQAALTEGLTRVFRLAEDKSGLKVLVLLKNGETLPEAWQNVEPFAWPESGVAGTKAELAALGSEEAALKAELASLAACRPALLEALATAENHLDYETARTGLAAEGALAACTAYVPAAQLPAVFKAAAAQGLAVQADDPTPDDTVPTLVKNNPVWRLAAPVFSLLGTVPGYWERDISAGFLLFFLVFFAMILGDAGYGLVFLLLGGLGALGAKAKGKPVPDLMRLTLLLSVFTIAWGTLSGTWFGDLLKFPGPVFDLLRSLVLPAFAQFTPVEGGFQITSYAGTVKLLCFSLGLVHLVLAHVWNFVTILRSGNWLKSLAQLGGLAVTVALYPLVLSLVISPGEIASLKDLAASGLLPAATAALFGDFPWVVPTILSGIGAILLFGSQEGKFLKGIGEGLAGFINTALGAIGWFSDNISYIRLFAVGLAGFAIAESFNGMGLGLSAAVGGGALGALAGGAVILFGHALNQVMGLLSVVVHGVRLNMLEYAGRLGMEWTGFAFKPLASRRELQHSTAKE